MRLAVAIVLVVGCRGEDYLSYTWDDRRVLCSESIDDMTQTLNWDRVEAQLAQAEKEGWVAIAHAHQPGITVSVDTIERLLTAADAHHLDYVTFDELVPDGPHRAGLAFAFDDDDVAGWMSVKDRLDAHHAHLTFFVTRWHELTSDELASLATLASDGHDLEPHSWEHVNAPDYVHDHSLDDYITDQVLPSIQIMIDAGYHPTSFAFPFGATTDPINNAVLEHIDRIRTTPGPCPY